MVEAVNRKQLVSLKYIEGYTSRAIRHPCGGLMRHIDEKAIRLVEDGRVTVTWETPEGDAGTGIVDGDTDTYRASFSPAGYVCTCRAGQNYRTCSHAIAVELKVAYERDRLQTAR